MLMVLDSFAGESGVSTCSVKEKVYVWLITMLTVFITSTLTSTVCCTISRYRYVLFLIMHISMFICVTVYHKRMH